jgi:hypothetical protein
MGYAGGLFGCCLKPPADGVSLIGPTFFKSIYSFVARLMQMGSVKLEACKSPFVLKKPLQSHQQNLQLLLIGSELLNPFL